MYIALDNMGKGIEVVYHKQVFDVLVDFPTSGTLSHSDHMNMCPILSDV